MCGRPAVVTVKDVDDETRERFGPRLPDAALVGGLWLLSLSIILGLVDGAGRQGLAAVIAFAHIAPLAWRRRHPEGVLLAMAATGLAFATTGNSVVCLGPAVLVAVYAVAAYGPPRRSLPLVGGATAAMAVAVAASGRPVRHHGGKRRRLRRRMARGRPAAPGSG